MRGLATFVAILWTLSVTYAGSPRGYNPDRDGELTQPRSEEELLHLRYEVGATVDPYTNQTRYDGFRLIRVYPQTKQHLNDLRFLETEESMYCDFWSDLPRKIGVKSRPPQPVDIMVSPRGVAAVDNFLRSKRIRHDVILSDIENEIERQRIDSQLEDEEEDREHTLSRLHKSHTSAWSSHQSRRRQSISDRSYPRNAGGGEVTWRRDAVDDLLGMFSRRLPSISLPPMTRRGRKIASGSGGNSLPDFPVVQSNCLRESRMSFKNYKSFSKMYNYMQCLAKSYPSFIELIEIGQSYEGRPLVVLKVKGLQQGNGRQRKAVWMDANIHAREWITNAAVLYFVNQLVENSGSRINKEIASGFDFYIMPMANPDGYEYSRTHDRLWRKTRSRHSGSKSCVGVDPNRNWGYHWGELGASTRTCSDTFRGLKPFSELNTRAISDFIMKLKTQTDLQLYMTIHSYGQYFMYPWGHQKIDVGDWKHLHSLAEAANEGFKSKGGYSYQIGSAAKMLYEASGGSDDWAKGVAKIKYSYTVELPDTGLYGFLLPKSEILPVGRSLHSAIYRLAAKLRTMQHTFRQPYPLAPRAVAAAAAK